MPPVLESSRRQIQKCGEDARFVRAELEIVELYQVEPLTETLIYWDTKPHYGIVEEIQRDILKRTTDVTHNQVVIGFSVRDAGYIESDGLSLSLTKSANNINKGQDRKEREISGMALQKSVGKDIPVDW